MRRDDAAARHVVLRVAALELGDGGSIVLVLTDGWYVARAVLDPISERRVLRGRIRVGEKIHVFGASLSPVERGKPFFFGDGDELGTSVLKICANNVRKRCDAPSEKLGVQKGPMVTDSLSWLVADGGSCPTVQVVLLRSYPLFYMECLTVANGEDDERQEFVSRREDAEFEARARFEDSVRQRYFEAFERRGRGEEGVDTEEVERRKVRCVKEVLVCGLTDDPCEERLRKTVRVYNPSEDLQTVLGREGQILSMSQIWPKGKTWTCKPQGILASNDVAEDVVELYPRRLCSLNDLECNGVEQGCIFDGVFCIVHVSALNHGSGQRFAYFADNAGPEIRILALEMSGFDTKCLPRPLRFNSGHGAGTKFPIVALRDVQFLAVSTQHELVHARATLQTSFMASKTLSRQRGKLLELKQALHKVEAQICGKEAQLEIMREAIMSFSSGARRSIGAYFTSTQDI